MMRDVSARRTVASTGDWSGSGKHSRETFRFRHNRGQKLKRELCKMGMGVFPERGRGHFLDSAARSTHCCKNTQFPKNAALAVTF